MHLWNDYEGSTIAGAFLLGRLLRTQGRSASFTTADRRGRAAIIRLTEALNDEEIIRARYRTIQAAAHPNLVTIEDFGDSELEGTPLTYVVTESTEESLAEIVAVRRLTVEETGEVALSVGGGLASLHEHGLVHGLLEPASVLAVGEVIKLRTDCVRLAPEGTEGDRARYRDVFGLADVLHRALTQQHLQEASDALALPEPYASIVRNVVRGSWGMDAVNAELRRYLRPTVSLVAPGVSVTGAPAPASASAAGPAPAAAYAAAFPEAERSRSEAVAPPRQGAVRPAQPEDTPSFAETLAAASRVFDRATAATGSHEAFADREKSFADDLRPEDATRPRLPFDSPESGGGVAARAAGGRGLAAAGESPEGEETRSWIEQRRGWVLGGAALVVLLVMLLLHFLGGPSHPQPSGIAAAPGASATAPQPVQSGPGGFGSQSGQSRTGGSQPIQSMTGPMPPAAAAAQGAAPAARRPSAGTPATAPASRPAAAKAEPATSAIPSGGKVWRVVAYTYNREDQAAAKARAIAGKHPNLHPVVFSRTGRAPYLVTLGGPLPEAQAAAMRQRARSEGLARDVYVQNYSR